MSKRCIRVCQKCQRFRTLDGPLSAATLRYVILRRGLELSFQAIEEGQVNVFDRELEELKSSIIKLTLFSTFFASGVIDIYSWNRAEEFAKKVGEHFANMNLTLEELVDAVVSKMEAENTNPANIGNSCAKVLNSQFTITKH